MFLKGYKPFKIGNTGKKVDNMSTTFKLDCSTMFKMSKDICKIFGKKLFELRKERGLSQEDLALEIDFDKSSIGKYEKAKRCINLRTAKKIADALGVKLSEMLD